MITKHDLVVVFDLDDTLYKEIDFLKSAYREIAGYLASKFMKSSDDLFSDMLNYYRQGLNAFEEIIKVNEFKDISIKELLNLYRNHLPDIQIKQNTHYLLENLRKEVFKIGIITDGRSVQQRNKILALGISNYIDDIIISEEFGSEKPNMNNFKYFEDKYGNSKRYIYIGDNTSKDFISPNNLGWYTICLLDDGKNIHKQTITQGKIDTPHFIVKDLIEVSELINQID